MTGKAVARRDGLVRPLLGGNLLRKEGDEPMVPKLQN